MLRSEESNLVLLNIILDSERSDECIYFTLMYV